MAGRRRGVRGFSGVFRSPRPPAADVRVRSGRFFLHRVAARPAMFNGTGEHEWLAIALARNGRCRTR